MMMFGSKCFKIEYAESVFKQDLPKLPQNIRQTLKNAIETRLVSDPIQFGKPLRYSLSGLRSLRVGDYRIIYVIDMKRYVVNILSIAHRRDAYENIT